MYLWIDLGNKKCWVAVYVNWIVLPKAIIPRTALVNNLKKYIKEYSVETIVLWLPYDLYWKDLRQYDRTKKFWEKIKEIFPNIELKYVDERFTSFQADMIVNDWTTWNKDDISAALILETYLSRQK